MNLKSDVYKGWEKDGFRMHELYVFEYGERYMLLDPEYGATLFLDSTLMFELREKDISDDFMFLLIQRGMAEYRNSRLPICTSHPRYPHFIMIDLTQSCNLDCVYCFRNFHNSLQMTDDMLFAICGKLVEYQKKHSDLRLHIQAWGGEPLLKLRQIIMMREYFDRENIDPVLEIETNGVLIDDNAAKALYDARINIGISIDGTPSVQNAQRPYVSGKATSEDIETGIRNIRKYYKDRFGSITVITKNTATHLDEILDYYINVLHLYGIKFNPLRDTGKLSSLALSPSELTDFSTHLFYKIVQYAKDGKFLREQNICQRLRNLTYRPCDNICNAYGCQGGYAMVSIDPNGDIFPCEMTDVPDMKLGNICTESIDSIAERTFGLHTGYFAPRRFSECEKCPWRFFCRGGCKSASLFSSGDSCAFDYAECAINKTLYPLLAKLLIEDPEIACKLMGNIEACKQSAKPS